MTHAERNGSQSSTSVIDSNMNGIYFLYYVEVYLLSCSKTLKVILGISEKLLVSLSQNQVCAVCNIFVSCCFSRSSLGTEIPISEEVYSQRTNNGQAFFLPK